MTNSVYVLKENNCKYLLSINSLSFRVRMSWNNRDNKQLLLELEVKLGLYHVVFTTPKTSVEKPTLDVVEMQQDTEMTDFKEEYSWLKWTINNGRRKEGVNLKAS